MTTTVSRRGVTRLARGDVIDCRRGGHGAVLEPVLNHFGGNVVHADVAEASKTPSPAWLRIR